MSDARDAMDPMPFAPGLLAGRPALVTGGGSGIGYGIARCLLRCGADVAIASRNLDRLEEAAARLGEEADTASEAAGVAAAAGAAGAGARPRVLAVQADVRDPERVRAAADEAAAALGGLAILVNNAAGNFHAPSETLSPNGFRAVVETDLHGTFHAAQAAFPHLREAGRGRIVNISMTLHRRGWPMMAHATAAKAGVDALTRTLALEWARHGITVNAVAPGPVPTEGVRRAFGPPRTAGADEGEAGVGAGSGEEGGGRGEANDTSADAFAGPRAAEAYARRFIPAGRVGRPEDIGWMVAYLCSPAADWITGTVLTVDGGESLASPRALPSAESPDA